MKAGSDDEIKRYSNRRLERVLLQLDDLVGAERGRERRDNGEAAATAIHACGVRPPCSRNATTATAIAIAPARKMPPRTIFRSNVIGITCKLVANSRVDEHLIICNLRDSYRPKSFVYRGLWSRRSDSEPGPADYESATYL